MENYKIRVNNEAEGKEAQTLFENLGYRKGVASFDSFPMEIVAHRCLLNKEYVSSRAVKLGHKAHSNYKEITIPQLRDLVVLKRNDVNDATHACESRHHRRGYLSSDGIEYIWFYGQNEWFKAEKSFNEHGLKPIEKTMKEYLNEKCELVNSRSKKFTWWIEVPEGAEEYRVNGRFYKDSGRMYASRLHPVKWILTPEDNPTYKTVWQRNAPAVSDEVNKSSKLKSVSETLKERQQQYGCFEDVAFVTENIMSILAKVRVNGLNDLPHTHRMALYMIASKMARIVNGDCGYKDNWHDIGGYAKLIENLLD